MSNIVSIINGHALTTSIVISEGVGYDHSTVIRLVREYKADLEEFGLLGFEIRPRPKGQHGGGDIEYALLNEDQATLLITYMRNNNVVRSFKKTLVKAFRGFRNNIHSIPQNFHEALLLAANLEKEKQLAQIERDEAVRTKAHISDKKTATAMARAANEKKRADKLEQQLGEHISWKKAKAIDWIPVVFQLSQGMWCQIGKYLKRVSDEMGIEARDIPDTTHNTVKAYHIDVITEAYKRIKEDPNILSKYRSRQKAA